LLRSARRAGPRGAVLRPPRSRARGGRSAVRHHPGHGHRDLVPFHVRPAGRPLSVIPHERAADSHV